MPGAGRRGAIGTTRELFQRSRAAIDFYEKHGFTIAEATHGADNEEREPDARMVWPGKVDAPVTFSVG